MDFRSLASPDLTKGLAALPLFGQSLVACRLARRAALAMLDGDQQATAISACSQVEEVIRTGEARHTSQPSLVRAANLPRRSEAAAAFEALRWANDSAGAAAGASDFPVDAIVTASAKRCIEVVAMDPRVARLQLAVVLKSDIDSIDFACREASIGTYDALGRGVFARLAPCHALTLVAPPPSPEDEHR